jgi:hypothetical protein
MKKNNIINISAIFLLIVSLISFSSAISVSRPYMENNQLNLTLGETKDLEFVLQNGGGATEPINVKVRVVEGIELIKITDASDIYLVAPGALVPVHFQISVPEGVKFGETYPILIEFLEANLNENTLSIGTGIDQSFNVFLTKTYEELEQERKSKNMVLLGIILLALIILISIIITLVKKRKKTKKTR